MRLCSILRFAVGSSFLAAPVAAHVTLDAPAGGERMVPGTTFTIRWSVATGHDTQNWHLAYSSSGPSGPWIPIAADLPPGDISTGAVHAFSWTIPDDVSLATHVRIQQDNGATVCEDVNAAPFSIGQAPLTTFRNGSGVNTPCFSELAPAIPGQPWTTNVQHSHHPGAAFTAVLGFSAPTPGTLVSNVGELLVDTSSAFMFQHVAVASGTADTHAIGIPFDVSFVGVTAHTQALIVGGGAASLCNALDSTVGL